MKASTKVAVIKKTQRVTRAGIQQALSEAQEQHEQVEPGTVAFNEYEVPEKYAVRLHSIDSFKTDQHGPYGRSGTFLVIFAYLRVGWNLDGDQQHHMIELEYTGRDAKQEDVRLALTRTRRCYCETCRDPESHSKKDRGVMQAIELTNLRATVAEANQIPLDGSDENEAKIDALLEGENDNGAD